MPVADPSVPTRLQPPAQLKAQIGNAARKAGQNPSAPKPLYRA